MKQVVIRNGMVCLEEVPAPLVGTETVLVQVNYSCISAGTELSAISASGQGLLSKVMAEPEKIGKALQSVRREGLGRTIRKVLKEEGSVSQIGYSAAGVVVEVGSKIRDIGQGDKVACAGAGWANHAEYICVPRHLLSKVPDGVDLKEACTVTLGAIAMHGVRRADFQLGDFVLVLGTGILGLLAVQLIRLAGGRCLAVDIDSRRLALAKEFGADIVINPLEEQDPVAVVSAATGGNGVDVVIFTAATSDSATLSQALKMVRKKGRLVMVGVYGNRLDRNDLYSKEIDFLISTSYGPGRYDEIYEQRGIDYPYAYVRWTENRNIEEYLRLLARRAVNLESMLGEVYPIERAADAYASLSSDSRPVMALLSYGKSEPDTLALDIGQRRVPVRSSTSLAGEGKVRVGVIGAGSFASNVHFPNLRKLSDKYVLLGVCNRSGFTAKLAADRFGAKYATTDYHQLLQDPEIDLIMICTRHDLHGRMTLESLQAGKDTFVEKPLCTSREELDAIKAFFRPESGGNVGQSVKRYPLLMVGFNRRFSRYACEAKRHTDARIGPLFIHYRMNAGHLPSSHWAQGSEGGGRIVGEACHIIDLFSFFTAARVTSVKVGGLHPTIGGVSGSDNKVIVVEYADGSVCVLEYFSVGSTEYPKEYMEIHFDQKTIVIDDYRALKGYGLKANDIRSKKSEKGQLEELIDCHEYLSGKQDHWPISLDDIIETTEITFTASNQGW
jgi:predicted dehydrogenase/threonine dehydrogenase-like Zn-dependent dehydrogenase